jgi:hypothetical protein
MEKWQHDHNPTVLLLAPRYPALNYNVCYEHTEKMGKINKCS